MIELRVAQRTHPGLVRPVNEDSLLARRPVFLVADGMGGHEAGDRASQAAIAAFNGIPPSGTASFETISAAYASARNAVAEIAMKTERGAGCTLTGVILVDDSQWLVLNIGDSRTYALEDSMLTQLTVDHSLRDEFIAGGIGADDPRLPARNVITRALGSGADEIDTWLRPVVADQRLLVSSDGLHGDVSAEHIRAVLLTIADTDEAADELMRLALDAGGSDNVSLIVVDVVSGASAAEPEDETADTLDVTRPR